jgi:hypothetical protein
VNPGIALPVVIAAAAVVVVPAAIARRQWALAIGFCAAGAGVGVQSPPVYAAIDPLFGGRNLTNLGYHLATDIGIAAFIALVLTAKPGRSRRRLTVVLCTATGVACAYECALFGIGSATAGWATADSHLSEKLTTPLFLAYAAVLWVGLAGLAVAAFMTQRAQTRDRPWSVAKVGTVLVAAGSGFALAWCVNAASRAVMSVARGIPAPVTDPLGQLLALTAGACVFAGLAITNMPHLLAWLDAGWLELGSRPLWRRAVRTAPEVALRPSGRAWLGGRATLYRHWVEIEDAVRLGRLQLTEHEREQVARMEGLFAAPTTSGQVQTSAERSYR